MGRAPNAAIFFGVYLDETAMWAIEESIEQEASCREHLERALPEGLEVMYMGDDCCAVAVSESLTETDWDAPVALSFSTMLNQWSPEWRDLFDEIAALNGKVPEWQLVAYEL